MLLTPPAEMSHYGGSKRKWSNIEAEDQRDTTFHLENVNDNTILNFETHSRLLRAHLPLSWLSSQSSSPSLSPGSLLGGTIQQPFAWEYAVQIARQIPNGGLVALEKIEDDVFTAYPLQPFVTEKWVADAAIGAAPPVSTQMMMHYIQPVDTPRMTPHSRTPSLNLEPTMKVTKNKRGAVARMSILSLPSPAESPAESPVTNNMHPPDRQSDSDIPATSLAKEGGISADAVNGQMANELADPIEDIAQVDHLAPAYLRQRYMETLYLTKEPVSFYCKGPLSRARARARADQSTMSLSDLAEFYRESILPVKKLQLKYKDSLQQAISTIITENQAAEQSFEEQKRKKSKKTKLGKDGIWPSELEVIRRWWTRESQASLSSEQHTKRLEGSINFLRLREAQMQIVLMLEIMSIEAKLDLPLPVLEPTPTDVVKVESIESDLVLELKQDKKTKKRDLAADLDVLGDRLCIWHSIGTEVLDSINDTIDANNARNDFRKDVLRDFCSDVLIVFYSSKLPVICKSLCKSLAGPDLYDRAQKEARLRSVTSKVVAPGAAISRRTTSQSSFERVLSAGDLGSRTPDVPIRSATLPASRQFSRQPSEIAGSRPLSRQTSMSFSSREVDLEADAQAMATKKRKLDLVAARKQELAQAIDALKKPNRKYVSNTYNQERDQLQQRLKQPVLIASTPRIDRRQKNDGNSLDYLPIPIELALVPASSSKSSSFSNRLRNERSSGKKRAVLAAISDTPVRDKTDGLDYFSSGNDQVQQDSSSPTHRARVQGTPSKPQTKQNGVFESQPVGPVAGGEKENIFSIPDMASCKMDRAMNMPVYSDSIYAALGWEVDDD